MLDNYYKILNHDKFIEERLDIIIDAFVNFYGEEKREYITNKFRSTTYISYLTLGDLNTILSEMKKIKTNECLEKIKSELNGYFNEDDFDKLFGKYRNYDNYSIHEYYSYLEKIQKGENVRLSYDLDSFDSNITKENILNGNFDEKMELLNKIKPVIDELNIEYSDFLISIDKYDEEAKKAYQLKSKLEQDDVYDFLNEFKDNIEKQEYDKLMQMYQKSGSIFMFMSKKLELMYGSSVNSPSLMEYFSEECDEKLVSGTNYEKEDIIKNRIKYFKENGIDLGNDYNFYLSDEKCKNLIPDKEFVLKIVNYKEQKREEIKKKVNENYLDYVYNNSKYNKNSIINDDDLYSFYEEEITCVCPDIVRDGEKLQEKPMMFINLGVGLEVLDANIIHEFNHLYELIYNFNADRLQTVIGWDVINSKYDEENGKYVEDVKENCKREYESLNEIINDLIAQKICKSMHSKGYNLVSDISNARYGSNGYQKMEILVDEFFSTFFDEIVKSRSNNQLNVIYDKVGQDNFETLNNLFSTFDEHLGGLEYVRCLEEYNNSEDTERTRALRKIIIERDLIIQNMKENHYNK